MEVKHDSSFVSGKLNLVDSVSVVNSEILNNRHQLQPAMLSCLEFQMQMS